MKCPYCGGEVKLSWKKYWASPLGNHNCPACDGRFRLNHSFRYYLIILGAALLLGLLLTLSTRFFKLSLTAALIFYALGGLVLLVPLDRWIDAKWRKTEPVHKKES
jgi:hypothetical protein